MSLYIFCFIVLVIKITHSSPSCKEFENYCIKCNPLTNLCSKCQFDNLIQDDNGGCIGAKKCKLGKNYCDECDLEGEYCNKCQIGYYPDKNGGCSYSKYCKLSNNGECIECEDDFILIGKDYELKICKNKNVDDFKNCEVIDMNRGKCQGCEEGYFIGYGDNKCTKTKYCNESIYGNCISCYEGFFLNKENNTCLLKQNNFLYCKESLNGNTCDVCDEMSYLDENGQCSLSNYCSESLNGECKKCISNYYLSSINSTCSTEKDCLEADMDTGICFECKRDFYLDKKDYKCKSNQEQNDFKYCKEVINEQCIECIYGYMQTKDGKCTPTSNCIEAKNGICISCEDNYYMGLDHKCTNIEHCIYSKDNETCLECEDNYYYNKLFRNCSKAIEQFKNCKYSFGYHCNECKNNYYLKNDSTCEDNTQEGPFYKCFNSDSNNEFCASCIEGYYLGSEDYKCSLVDNCKLSKDENTCIECDDYYCLDSKKENCIENDYIDDENNIFYFNCKMVNKEGTACEKCIEGYEVGENGYCVDVSRCLEKKDGKCLRCTEEKSNDGYSYCVNKIFGCVESLYDNCLRCDDLLDIYKCTECKEGYKLGPYFGCLEI